MPRCDDDTRYLSESIGPTGLSTGASRVGESRSQLPLFTDPYALLFDAGRCTLHFVLAFPRRDDRPVDESRSIDGART